MVLKRESVQLSRKLAVYIGPTVLLVELLNFEYIFAVMNDIKIELIPPRESRNPRTRNMG